MDVAEAIVAVVVALLALLGLIALVGMLSEYVSARRNRPVDFQPSFGSDDADAAALARTVADDLAERFDWFTTTPERLEADERFATAVEALSDDTTPVTDVVELARDGNSLVASIALAALARRNDVPHDWTDWALRNVSRPSLWEDAFLLAALAEHAPGATIGRVLARSGEIRSDLVTGFVRRRLESGEHLELATFEGHVSVAEADEVASFLDRFGAQIGGDVREVFDEWRALAHLRDVGRLWQRPFDSPPALLVGRRRELVELIASAMDETPRRSVLIVGEHGSGKTALIRCALDRLEHTVVFEATASQVIAGAVYIGEIDGRVKQLADALEGRDIVWALPELQEALFAGQHTKSPHGLLDILLPHVESGAVTIVAEITPSAFEVVKTERPRVTTAFDVMHLRTLESVDSVAVAQHALDHDGLAVTASEETLERTYDLAQQFLPGIAPPGNVLRLVRATAAEAEERRQPSFDAGDVVEALAAASGLPLELLDSDTRLRLDDVRSFFEERIVRQPEAVNCLVERIAMIKAGVTDPTRPLGVFLFLGPTGTGKTEIAKTLAEYLFGSAERLIRLDMSEFQTPESLERLLSDATDGRGAGLISSVRSDPFGVILLDEFEKAASPVWDLFLQVFDDGRLTDSHGRLVDFRRCVIILTSNVGSAIASGSGLGFEPGEHGFSAAAAERALYATFRPEFLNRLDRVVTFAPFDRSAMRSLLDKELRDALARRGLRERPWAVEVDESAYAFLIDKGFSPTLGARPLKRAVEQHVLVPLAQAIVEQTVPAGDQFLFLRAHAGARIDVAFVDPDAESEDHGDEVVAPLDARGLARTVRTDEEASRFLLREAEHIGQAVASLGAVKAGALAALNEPTFWETPGRFAVLAKAEYLDRLETATGTAQRLAERLERSLRSGGRANGELVELLAGRLYVLDRALEGLETDDPFELVVEVVPSDRGSSSFAEQLTGMYVSWATRRGMDVERLVDGPHRHVLAVSGLGCWRILHAEAGLHVLEHEDTTRSGSRIVGRDTVHVAVLPREPGPPENGDPATMGRTSAPELVVRRYRPGSAPLVRDSVRGYRTGRLDRVLDGEFDLF